MRMIARLRWLLFVVVVLSISAVSFGQIGITVSIGPPALPVYVQPPCPAEGYIWTPGYWAWDPDYGQYYWVPGTWVPAPEPGYLWTPPWWGWGPGGFLFHEGFWGLQVGFYGGVNYGFGYFGNGYEGGRWNNGQFYYNRTVNNVNVTNIHNTYNTTVINNNTTINRVSYNGGPGGITARATPQEEAADRERHLAPVAAQTQHIQAARANPELRESVNHGKPPIAATAKPGEFRGGGATPAKEAGEPYKPAAERSVPRPGGAAPAGRSENNVPRPPTHAAELQQHQAARPNTGNSQLDQRYAQQQEKLANKQNQEHQRLQQRQQAQDQRLAQRNAGEAQRQQMEQRHAQQTQQLEQRHQQQTQRMQQKQSPPPPREGAPPHR